MTEKIIISKELNEWLEEHQTLDTDDILYSERFGNEVSNELIDKVWLKISDTKRYSDVLKAFGLYSCCRLAHLWLLLNRDKWEVEEDELFYVCIPEPESSIFSYTSLSKDDGMQFFDELPNYGNYKWTQEEIDKHEVAKHLQHFKKKVEE